MSESLKAKTDIIVGIFIAIFAIIFYVETYNFGKVKVINTVDATFMPRIIGALVFLFSMLLILKSCKAYFSIPKENRVIEAKKTREKRADGYIRFIAAFSVMLLGAIFFKKLGFILTMPWVMFSLFCIIEKKEKRRYKLYLALSMISPIVLFLAFYYGFTTLLPVGILKRILTYM